MVVVTDRDQKKCLKWGHWISIAGPGYYKMENLKKSSLLLIQFKVALTLSYPYHDQALSTNKVWVVWLMWAPWRFLGPGSVGKGVLWNGTVAHARTQALVCNAEMTV